MQAVQTALLWYARNVPHHRGKQRLSDYLRRIFKVSLQGEYVERRGGLTWAMDPGDYTQEDVFWSGAKDRAEIGELLRNMPKGGVMFDLGASFGYYSITIAAALDGDCRVYAFEPNPPTLRRFRKNLELNSIRGVYPREEGFSDAPGSASMVDLPANSGASYLNGGGNIPVTTMDLFCEQHQIDRLDVVKIDIEGAELRALRGGLITLRRFKPVILIELNPSALARDHSTVRDVVVLLEDLGYQIFTVRPRTPVTRDHLPREGEIVNAVCNPKA
jgi:FkbM family methyltransferase